MLTSHFTQEDFGVEVEGGGEVTKTEPLPFKYKAGGRTLCLVVAKGKASKHGKLFICFERAQMRTRRER